MSVKLPFEGENATALERAGFFAPTRGTRYYAAHESPQPFSHPSSPATPISTNTDDVSFRSARSSYNSYQPHALDHPPMPDHGDTPSPKSVPFPPFSPANDLPSPHLPLKKKDPSRLRLHVTAGKASSHSPPISPSPSPRRDVFAQQPVSPLLPPPRPSLPQSPLSTFAPKTASPTADSYHKFDFTIPKHRGSDPSAPGAATWNRPRGLTASSAGPGTTVDSPLKASSSTQDLSYSALGSRTAVSSTYKPERGPISREPSISFRREPPLPWMDSTEARGSVRSFRSAWTNASGMTYESSAFADASETERSSINSSYDILPKVPSKSPKEEPMTVEDAIDMYYGFDIDDDLERRPDSIMEPSSDMFSQSGTTYLSNESKQSHQPSLKSVDSLDFSNSFEYVLSPQNQAFNFKAPVLEIDTINDLNQQNSTLQPLSPNSILMEYSNTELPELTPSNTIHSPLRLHPVGIESSPPLPPSPKSPSPPPPVLKSEPFIPEPRDRYGFKKATREVTVDQYDAWNENYTTYLERRRKKWDALMLQYGLDTECPIRFPPKSDKVKRYVRKGIPPEWRGAAWFWYAGGQDRLNKEPGLYHELVEQALNGQLSDTDRDMIERDLHRTFPDSIKFKPDPSEQPAFMSALPGRDIRPNRSPSKGETRIVGSLRRVLQAFALHNPSIGYCQSLNFLAGLLLLMLDEDEQKAFILLEVITNVHFPGIHAKVLEAEVDIGVLMMCIQESMPAVWTKINDLVEEDRPVQSRGRNNIVPLGSKLPTVHLVLTQWFMPCFVNTLPLESVLRVWDTLFYEGSKTVFRIALTIFKSGEADIRAIRDQPEVFQVVQAIPRRLLDINTLMEMCFKRRNGFGHISQETIDARRHERREIRRREQREREHERRMLERGRERGKTMTSRNPLPASSTEQLPQSSSSSPSSSSAAGAVAAYHHGNPPLPPLPPLPANEMPPRAMTYNDGSRSATSRDRSRPPTRDSANGTGDERQGRLRAAASMARKFREQSRGRRREKKGNGAEGGWNDAN
jgi:TBC1 domain family member 6